MKNGAKWSKREYIEKYVDEQNIEHKSFQVGYFQHLTQEELKQEPFFKMKNMLFLKKVY